MDMLASNTTEEARRVFCIYPISGTYTSFQRNLFYLTTAFALLGHAHEWLTAGCLAFAVSYSSTAAIHGLALAFQGDSHRDGDTLAVDTVLVWAIWASYLCWLFYPRFFYGKLALLVRGWSILVVTSHLALSLNTPRIVSNMASSLVLSRLDENGQWSEPCARMTARTLFRGAGDSMSSIDFGKINIPQASLLQPSGDDSDVIPVPADLTAAQLVPFLVADFLKKSLIMAPSMQTLSVDRQAARNKVFVRLLAKRVLHTKWKRKGGVQLCLAMVTVRILQLQWFLDQFFPVPTVVEFPARIAASILFRCLRTRRPRLHDISYLEPRISKRTYQAAKYAAVSFYMLISLGYVTWIPAVASFTSTKTSDFFATIPESETFRAVGQWSSWLALFLAIAVSVTQRILGRDEVQTKDSWFQQIRLAILYVQARDWLANEWEETCTWWRYPEKEAIASLRAAEQDDDTDNDFASRMIQALGESTDWTGSILPLHVPMDLYGQCRGQGNLPHYRINGVKSTTLGKTGADSKQKGKRA